VKGKQAIPLGRDVVAHAFPSLDYLFQLAIEMKKLGISWLSDIP
jgi:hypothetical protein